jgi:hypothetical protein
MTAKYAHCGVKEDFRFLFAIDLPSTPNVSFQMISGARYATTACCRVAEPVARMPKVARENI